VKWTLMSKKAGGKYISRKHKVSQCLSSNDSRASSLSTF
jgi:hypothetical protein